MSDIQSVPEAEIPEVAAPEVEIQAEQQEPTEEKPRAEKVVPLQALHEERYKNRELKGEITRLRQEQAQRDELLARRLEMLEASRQPRQERPQDPFEGLQYDVERINKHLEASSRQQSEVAQREAAQRQQVEFANRVRSEVMRSEAAYVQTHPDYYEAAQHLGEARSMELRALGLSPAEIHETLQMEAMQLAVNTAQRGLDTAEIVYELASAKGYKPKPKSDEKLETLKKGVAAAQSLGSGGAAKEKITLESLAKMSEDEFVKLTSGDNWSKLHGQS